ncbi:diaminopimelate epimerase [Paenibacillus sp. RC67]|uniref:diaminopimelate epimerase n=1 Tax=Paenibacillus sp. RC67 TaxID=3039392 RepID=UPI0024ACC03A|nr:diaminopimelate epimerase [Paenibacillus sp. RC67]
MKLEIEFVKFNPTQNMTILVRTQHPINEYAYIASKMMSYDHVYAEQVGFIEEPIHHGAAAHLQMAGGEFCGNACMALAALIASERGIVHNDWMNIELEASGTEQFIACQVKKIKEQYVCQVSMPIPNKIEKKTLNYEGDDLDIAIVRYHDFLHIVIEVEQFDLTMRNKAQGLAKLLGVVLGANLIGVLLFKSDSHELAPLIYVPPLDSMIWERGCGSGTASLGAYLSWIRQAAIAVPIRQPGGTIHVTADCYQDEVTNLRIEGSVEIVAQGKAYIHI